KRARQIFCIMMMPALQAEIAQNGVAVIHTQFAERRLRVVIFALLRIEHDGPQRRWELHRPFAGRRQGFVRGIHLVRGNPFTKSVSSPAPTWPELMSAPQQPRRAGHGLQNFFVTRPSPFRIGWCSRSLRMVRSRSPGKNHGQERNTAMKPILLKLLLSKAA